LLLWLSHWLETSQDWKKWGIKKALGWHVQLELEEVQLCPQQLSWGDQAPHIAVCYQWIVA